MSQHPRQLGEAFNWVVGLVVLLLLVLSLLLFGCTNPRLPANPPLVWTNAPAEYFHGLAIQFPAMPQPEVVLLLVDAGANLSPNSDGRAWQIKRFDRHNQYQQGALNAALLANATIGPLHE